MTRQLKVSYSDISFILEQYNAIHHMLATFGWGATMSDEHSDSTLSLAKIHAL